jgi:Fe-S cluster assembly ATP-binding protein
LADKKAGAVAPKQAPSTASGRAALPGQRQATPLLDVQDLHVEVDGKDIVRGLSLKVYPGEVHAIMGPNGSGKSTLAYVIAGREGYNVTKGKVLYDGKDILALDPEDRARLGIFLAFQYPVELPGVANSYFLRESLNAQRKHRGEDEMDAVDFLDLLKEKARLVGMDEKMLSRGVNEGFSGGEKKRNEILQMAVLEPRLAVLDETDSGLDIDALRTVANGVNALRDPRRSIVLVTHYQRLLDHIVPDRVHVLSGGRIVKSGGKELALELEKTGYETVKS